MMVIDNVSLPVEESVHNSLPLRAWRSTVLPTSTDDRWHTGWPYRGNFIAPEQVGAARHHGAARCGWTRRAAERRRRRQHSRFVGFNSLNTAGHAPYTDNTTRHTGRRQVIAGRPMDGRDSTQGSDRNQKHVRIVSGGHPSGLQFTYPVLVIRRWVPPSTDCSVECVAEINYNKLVPNVSLSSVVWRRTVENIVATVRRTEVHVIACGTGASMCLNSVCCIIEWSSPWLKWSPDGTIFHRACKSQ